MARIRTLKPVWWSHPVMAREDPIVQLMAIALLNYADDEGYFLAEPALVRAFARPYDDDYGKTNVALKRLSELGWIEIKDSRDHGPIGIVVNFTKHQVINNASKSKIKCYLLPDDYRSDAISPTVAVTESYSLEGKGIRNREMNNNPPTPLLSKANGKVKPKPPVYRDAKPPVPAQEFNRDNPWERAKVDLAKVINQHSFETWIKPTRFHALISGVLYIRVPTKEFMIIADKYADLVMPALEKQGVDTVKYFAAEEEVAG